MKQMTWLDLYSYLYNQANNIENIGKFDWNTPVLIHDAETGNEYDCDTYIFDDKMTLTINMDSIFAEKGQGHS
jgi:hypothetical protein